MEVWDQDYIDLVEPGYFNFDSEDLGGFQFGAVQGSLDCRINEEQVPRKIEFSWDGNDDGTPMSGRGWAVLENNNQLSGMIYIHFKLF